MRHYLDYLADFVNQMRSTNSRILKEELLKKWWDDAEKFEQEHKIENLLKKMFHYVYDYDKQYYVTSTNILKKDLTQKGVWLGKRYTFIWDLLDDLSNRVITGHSAIIAVQQFLKEQYDEKREKLILNIIDKDLKCGLSEVTINKVCGNIIKTYNVALADKFNPKKHKLDSNWVIEQKYDGIRVNCIFYDKDNIKFFSRKGKEIKTLDFLKPSILKLNLPNNTVIDGEICKMNNGLEDFLGIVSYIYKGIKK